MLLWDGSTAGVLTPYEAVSQSNYTDMSISIHSAMLFPKVTESEDFNSVTDLREVMNVPCNIPDKLYGRPLAVTSVPGDNGTAQRLKLLKAGMWLRLRNLHVDIAARDASYPSTSSSSSSVVSLQSPTTSTTASTSPLPSPSNNLDSASSHASHVTATHIVGTIHSDTYFSLLLPYYR